MVITVNSIKCFGMTKVHVQRKLIILLYDDNDKDTDYEDNKEEIGENRKY